MLGRQEGRVRGEGLVPLQGQLHRRRPPESPREVRPIPQQGTLPARVSARRPQREAAVPAGETPGEEGLREGETGRPAAGIQLTGLVAGAPTGGVGEADAAGREALEVDPGRALAATGHDGAGDDAAIGRGHTHQSAGEGEHRPQGGTEGPRAQVSER